MLKKNKIPIILTAALFAAFTAGICFAETTALTQQDRETWILAIKRVKMKPPCCGACKLLTQKDAKAIWEYLTTDSPEKKKAGEAVWLEHKAKLLGEFKYLNPQRYQALYKNEDLDETGKNKGGK